MRSITHLNGSPRETDAAWLCRKKARECQRTALTTTDPEVRFRYLHLAKLWHEMAREAERKANCSSSSDTARGHRARKALDKAVVIFPMRFQKRSSAPSEQTGPFDPHAA
jgi:hypothetical protein